MLLKLAQPVVLVKNGPFAYYQKRYLDSYI